MYRSRSGSFMSRQLQPNNRSMFISVSVLGAIIIIFLFAFKAFGEDLDNGSLVLVSIIFRHGDKTPTESYASDPYKDDKFWPEGWGQLTIKGKSQMYQLGINLRTRYKRFIGKYSLESIRVDSSDADRCLQSAAVLLAALFPPEDSQIWNPDLLWQPVPIHATPRSLDKLIVVKAPCPQYYAEKRKIDLELATNTSTIYKDLYEYLSNHAGEAIDSIQKVESLYNILEIEDEKGLTLPEWTESVFPDKMRPIATLCLSSFTYTPLLKRLYGGPLVGQMMQHMIEKQNGRIPKNKMFLYSAHDLTLVNVWQAMGFKQLLKPEYGAAIIVELHLVEGQYEVQMQYINSSTSKSPTRLNIPQCNSPCRLDDFNRIMQPVIPVDWDQECQIKRDRIEL
uniref:Acid phosphatase n=2 Tax=Clastoptera arizonana TaxID=38151 RepID=A0A1B6CBF9_9HEMI